MTSENNRESKQSRVRREDGRDEGEKKKIKMSPSTRRDGRGIPTKSLLCRSDEQAFAAVVILRIRNARMLYTLYACGADEENKINAFRTIHGSQYDKLVCLVRPGINVICYAPHIIATTVTAAATYPTVYLPPLRPVRVLVARILLYSMTNNVRGTRVIITITAPPPRHPKRRYNNIIYYY